MQYHVFTNTIIQISSETEEFHNAQLNLLKPIKHFPRKVPIAIRLKLTTVYLLRPFNEFSKVNDKLKMHTLYNYFVIVI